MKKSDDMEELSKMYDLIGVYILLNDFEGIDKWIRSFDLETKSFGCSSLNG